MNIRRTIQRLVESVEHSDDVTIFRHFGLRQDGDKWHGVDGHGRPFHVERHRMTAGPREFDHLIHSGGFPTAIERGSLYDNLKTKTAPQKPAPPPPEHEAVLAKHGFEYAASEVDDHEQSNAEWDKFEKGLPHKEDHELPSYWEAYHGEHSSGKTHCVWIYPNHEKGMHWIHGEGDPHEQMAHDIGKALHPLGLAGTVPPEPAPMKQHEGFGLPSLKQHLKKHFPIQ